MGKSEDNRYYMVRGNWDPSARGFKELTHLNDETPKGMSDIMCMVSCGLKTAFFFFLVRIVSFYGFVQISERIAPDIVIANALFFFLSFF
jgi:hypothetical protein